MTLDQPRHNRRRRVRIRCASLCHGASLCQRVTLRVLILILSATGLVACGDAGDGAAAGSVAAIDGETIYNRNCYSCHAAGVAGAPKVGVAEDWQPRAAKGPAALLASTISGIAPCMPAKGLCGRCSDAELTAAIDHMLAVSGVSYPRVPEPEMADETDQGTGTSTP